MVARGFFATINAGFRTNYGTEEFTVDVYNADTYLSGSWNLLLQVIMGWIGVMKYTNTD